MHRKKSFFPYKQPLTTQFAQAGSRLLIHIIIIPVLGFSTLKAQEPKQKTNSELKKTSKEVAISKVNKPLTYYIVFENGKTELNKDMKEKLDKICNVFQNNSSDSLDILSGSEQNALYKQRSISVNNYLISKGIPKTQIRFIEVGKIKATREIQLILKE